MNLDEILHEFSSKHYTSSLGTPTHRIGDFDEAKADILKWVLEQIPEKSIDYDDNYRDGFNACRDLMITKFKEV